MLNAKIDPGSGVVCIYMNVLPTSLLPRRCCHRHRYHPHFTIAEGGPYHYCLGMQLPLKATLLCYIHNDSSKKRRKKHTALSCKWTARPRRRTSLRSAQHVSTHLAYREGTLGLARNLSEKIADIMFALRNISIDKMRKK